MLRFSTPQQEWIADFAMENLLDCSSYLKKGVDKWGNNATFDEDNYYPEQEEDNHGR